MSQDDDGTHSRVAGPSEAGDGAEQASLTKNGESTAPPTATTNGGDTEHMIAQEGASSSTIGRKRPRSKNFYRRPNSEVESRFISNPKTRLRTVTNLSQTILRKTAFLNKRTRLQALIVFRTEAGIVQSHAFGVMKGKWNDQVKRAISTIMTNLCVPDALVTPDTHGYIPATARTAVQELAFPAVAAARAGELNGDSKLTREDLRSQYRERLLHYFKFRRVPYSDQSRRPAFFKDYPELWRLPSQMKREELQKAIAIFDSSVKLSSHFSSHVVPPRVLPKHKRVARQIATPAEPAMQPSISIAPDMTAMSLVPPAWVSAAAHAPNMHPPVPPMPAVLPGYLSAAMQRPGASVINVPYPLIMPPGVPAMSLMHAGGHHLYHPMAGNTIVPAPSATVEKKHRVGGASSVHGTGTISLETATGAFGAPVSNIATGISSSGLGLGGTAPANLPTSGGAPQH